MEAAVGTYKFLVFIDALKTKDIGAQNKNVLTEYVTWAARAELSEVEEHCSAVHLERMYDSNLVRIMFNTKQLIAVQRRAMIYAMAQLDAKFMTDVAPPGFMERALSQYIQNLEDQAL